MIRTPIKPIIVADHRRSNTVLRRKTTEIIVINNGLTKKITTASVKSMDANPIKKTGNGKMKLKNVTIPMTERA